MSVKYSVKIAALIVMTSIFFSRILGFIREILITNIYGRSIETDAFYAAFTIPDFMFYLLVGGTLSSGFIPIFTSYLAKGNEEEGWRIASNFANIVFISLLILTVLGIIFAPYIVPLIAYKFSGEQLALTIKLTRIMFPAVAFTCLAGLQAGILNAYQKFAISSLGPIVYNIGIIMSLIILGDTYGIEGIAYGVVISAAANFVIQLLALSNKLNFYQWLFEPRQEGLNQIIKLAIPSIIGLSISQINLIITQNIASGFDEGSITALRLANAVMSLPIGIFAMGISTAIFPTMTRQIALSNLSEYKETFSLGIRTILFITIPASVGMIVLREPIVRFLFSSGQFNEHDVQVTAYVLFFFAIGIAFSGGIQLLTKGFYSIHDTITPVILGFITIIINVILNILFLKYSSFSIGGLALATSLSAAVNMILLLVVFRKKMNGIDGLRILKTVTLTILTSIVMGIIINKLLYTIPFSINTKFGQTIEVFTLITIGFVVFAIFSIIFKMEEGQYFMSVIKSRLKPSNNDNN